MAEKSSKKPAPGKKATNGSRNDRQPVVAPAGKVSSSSFITVGIGASAGGLQAFTDLLRQLPADTGMAFVFVQHLHPKHVSILSELLSRETAMSVHEVKDGTRVEPNKVFVIPRDTVMHISDGVLR